MTTPSPIDHAVAEKMLGDLYERVADARDLRQRMADVRNAPSQRDRAELLRVRWMRLDRPAERTHRHHVQRLVGAANGRRRTLVGTTTLLGQAKPRDEVS